MRCDRLRTVVTALLLSLLLAVGSLGCLVTGFQLPVASGQNILLLWVLAGLLISGLMMTRKGWEIVVCLLALAAGYLWYRNTLPMQLGALLWQLLEVYGRVYGVDFSPIWQESWAASAFDYPLTVYGVLLEAATARTVCRRKRAFLPVLLAGLPLSLCMVVTDTVPNNWALVCLLWSLGLLVLTGSVRRESSSQGNRLVTVAAVPTLLTLCLLFSLVPREGYVRRTDSVRDYVTARLEQLWFSPEDTPGKPFFLPEESDKTVELSALNGQPSWEIPILQINADRSGTVYLRGQDYDRYDGINWESTPTRQEEFSGWGEPANRFSITTFASRALLYLPYFPEDGVVLSGGSAENTEHRMTYTFTCRPGGSAFTPETLEQYLALPEQTRTEAEKLLPQSGSSTRHLAAQIGALVRNSARYDRNTGKMRQDAPDFALWFLQESDTGYCVHFAVASVVLLRAAGIPARYVTGYKAETLAGESVVVTSEDAHAWAEYYDSELGMWQILEATPAEVPQTCPEEPSGWEQGMASQSTQSSLTDSASTESSSPSSGTAESDAVPSHSFRNVGLGLALLPGLLALLYRAARLTLRKRILKHCNTNTRALHLWQMCQKYTRQLGEQLPEELEALAEKAKYSQHKLAPEELSAFREYLRRCRRELQKKPWYFQVLYKYILVLY